MAKGVSVVVKKCEIKALIRAVGFLADLNSVLDEAIEKKVRKAKGMKKRLDGVYAALDDLLLGVNASIK